MILLVLAWLFFAVGAASALAFILLYLAKVQPWHRRQGEPVEVREVRLDILAWSGTVVLLYLRGGIGLASSILHPSTSPDQLAIAGIVATLTTHRLVTYIRVNRRRSR